MVSGCAPVDDNPTEENVVNDLGVDFYIIPTDLVPEKNHENYSIPVARRTTFG